MVLPVEVPPATRMLQRSATAARNVAACPARHDAGGDIVVEGEDGDRGFADGEGRRRDDGRQQTLKALAGLGQLGGDARRAGVHLGADMMRDEPDDAFAIAGRQTLSRIDKPTGQPIDPEPAVGVEHDFDDGGVFQPKRNGGAKCGAQHARAARGCFLVEMMDCHLRSPGHH